MDKNNSYIGTEIVLSPHIKIPKERFMKPALTMVSSISHQKSEQQR